MVIVSILAAGVAAFLFGAIWYSVFAKQWVATSGVVTDETGQPANRSAPIPYIAGMICAVVFAAMLNYAMPQLSVDTVAKGALSGIGAGLFLTCPWIITCYGFAGRPRQLMLIDCGYATFGSTVAGAVLMLF